MVKSELPQPSQYINDTRWDISIDAYHLAQLNARAPEGNIDASGNVHLRGYKYLTSWTSTATGRFFENHVDASGRVQRTQNLEWRSYLEFCPDRTLAQLVLLYTAWGYHLPEAFIWFSFHMLAKSCVSMDSHVQFPFCREKPSEDFGKSFNGSLIIHNDIKDENTFLGDRPTTAWGLPYVGYPCPKMADFGLSQVTSMGTNDNVAYNTQIGTYVWQPPEKRDPRRKKGLTDKQAVERTAGASFYPYKEYLMQYDGGVDDPNHNFRHAIGPPSNIFAVGLMMHNLITLDDIGDLDAQINFKLKNPAFLSQAELYLFDDVTTNLSDEDDYSDELKALVRECTRVEPEKRPTSLALYQKTYQGMQREQRRLLHVYNGDAGRIWRATRIQTGSEPQAWNQTPQGPFDNISHWSNQGRIQWWKTFVGMLEKYADPDQPRFFAQGRTHWLERWEAGWDFLRGQMAENRLTVCMPSVREGMYYQGPRLPRGGRSGPPKEEIDEGSFGEYAGPHHHQKVNNTVLSGETEDNPIVLDD